MQIFFVAFLISTITALSGISNSSAAEKKLGPTNFKKVVVTGSFDKCEVCKRVTVTYPGSNKILEESKVSKDGSFRIILYNIPKGKYELNWGDGVQEFNIDSDKVEIGLITFDI